MAINNSVTLAALEADTSNVATKAKSRMYVPLKPNSYCAGHAEVCSAVPDGCDSFHKIKCRGMVRNCA